MHSLTDRFDIFLSKLYFLKSLLQFRPYFFCVLWQLLHFFGEHSECIR